MAKFKPQDTVAFVDHNGWAIIGKVIEYDADERAYLVYGESRNGQPLDNYGQVLMPSFYLKKYDGDPKKVEKFLAKELEEYRKNKEITVNISGTLMVKGPVGSDRSLLEKAIKKAVAQIYGQRATWYNDLRIS